MWTELTVSLYRDQLGTPKFYVAIIQDLTERNRVEEERVAQERLMLTQQEASIEALRQAEERTRFALRNANIGIWDWDCASGALTWSETLEAHYGLAARHLWRHLRSVRRGHSSRGSSGRGRGDR